LAVTLVPTHSSFPLAVDVEVNEQAPEVGAVNVPVKLATSPGANLAAVKTGVLPLRSLTTATFVSATLPALLTVPLKVSKAPGNPGATGQFCVTTIRGLVSTRHVAGALSVMVLPPHRSAAVAVTVLMIVHTAFTGTVYRPVKFAVAPGANVAALKTMTPGAWSLTTTTFVSVMSPAFRTVPLKVNTAPGATGAVGHVCVTTMRAEV
jgi:hypothetical protein